MQLTYRGKQYEMTTSPLATVPGEVIDRYRGVTLIAQRCNFVPSHSLNLVYRGAPYYPVTSSVQLTDLLNAI
jgi:hypothetical protein